MHDKIRTAAVAVMAAALVTLLGPPVVAGAAEKVQQVFVTNTAASPLPIADAGRPVQAQVRLDADGSINWGRVLYVVPAGRRLEVQHVSFQDGGVPTELTSVTLAVVQGGVSRQIFLPTHRHGASSTDVASEAVTAYADPGTEVYISAHTESPVAFGSMWASFSGVLRSAAW